MCRIHQKPNILLSLLDDLGNSDLDCFGSERETPTIDSLAGNGVRFTGMYNCVRCCRREHCCSQACTLIRPVSGS